MAGSAPPGESFEKRECVPGVEGEMASFPSWDVSRPCLVCEDGVPEEHYVVSHFLAPLTLAVCYECFSWRDTWDDLAEEYFDNPVDR